MFRKLANFLFGTMPNPADATKYYDGSGQFSTPAGGTIKRQFTWVIGNGTDVITTGLKGSVSIPVNCTITRWRILSTDSATTSGSIVIDLWRDTYANFPPSNAESITAGAEPEVTTDVKDEDTTGTWDNTCTAGDVIAANVDSVSDFTQVELMVEADE